MKALKSYYKKYITPPPLYPENGFKYFQISEYINSLPTEENPDIKFQYLNILSKLTPSAHEKNHELQRAKLFSIWYMVLILDGNSVIDAHVRSNRFYLICLRHFISSRTVTNRFFFLRKDLLSFMRAQHVLTYHLI